MKPRAKLEKLASKKGIKRSHEKTTETLIELFLPKYPLGRKNLNIIASNFGIKEPNRIPVKTSINAFKRYLVVSKLKKLNLNNLINRYISINDIERIKKLNKLSHSTLKKLAELYNKLKITMHCLKKTVYTSIKIWKPK